MEEEKTQIQITIELRDFLLANGRKAESYDEVIKRLVGYGDYGKNKIIK